LLAVTEPTGEVLPLAGEGVEVDEIDRGGVDPSTQLNTKGAWPLPLSFREGWRKSTAFPGGEPRERSLSSFLQKQAVPILRPT